MSALTWARGDLERRIARFDRRRHLHRAALRVERRMLAAGVWDVGAKSRIQETINRALTKRRKK